MASDGIWQDKFWDDIGLNLVTPAFQGTSASSEAYYLQKQREEDYRRQTQQAGSIYYFDGELYRQIGTYMGKSSHKYQWDKYPNDKSDVLNKLRSETKEFIGDRLKI